MNEISLEKSSFFLSSKSSSSLPKPSPCWSPDKCSREMTHQLWHDSISFLQKSRWHFTGRNQALSLRLSIVWGKKSELPRLLGMLYLLWMAVVRLLPLPRGHPSSSPPGFLLSTQLRILISLARTCQVTPTLYGLHSHLHGHIPTHCFYPLANILQTSASLQ